jgi:hypothetical protein
VDRCAEENPPLLAVGESHFAACWEWETVAKAAEQKDGAAA